MRSLKAGLVLLLAVVTLHEVKAEATDNVLGEVQAIEREVTIDVEKCVKQLQVKSIVAGYVALYHAECDLVANEGAKEEVLFAVSEVTASDNKYKKVFRGDARGYKISVEVPPPSLSNLQDPKTLESAAKMVRELVRVKFPTNKYRSRALQVVK